MIIFCVSLPYLTIIQNDFVWDDFEFILQWETIRSFDNIPKLLLGETPPVHGGVYRPVRSIFYLFNFALFGQNPTLYHLNGIIFHLISVLFVFAIVRKMIPDKTIAFFAAILFGLHPAHTAVVAFITANFDFYGVIFFFAAFYFYISSDGKKGKRLSLSYILATFAYFGNEITMSYPFLILLYDFTLRPDRKKEDKKIFVRNFLIALGIVFLNLFLRFGILKIGLRTGPLTDSFYFTMLTMAKAFLRYIYLAFIPIDFNVVPTFLPGVTAFDAEYFALRCKKLPMYKQ